MLAVGAPTRDSVPDSSVMQIDEPRFLGNRLKRETVLTDADGRTFRVGEVLGKPLILLLSYYGCDGTCPTMNAELAKALEGVKRFRLGQDYRVLTVSFDKIAHDLDQLEALMADLHAGSEARSTAGRTSDRTPRSWKQRLADYEAPPLDTAVAEALDEYVARRSTALKDENLYA